MRVAIFTGRLWQLLISKAAVAAVLVGVSTSRAAYINPKHFAEPTAIPSYGPNNYIPTFGAPATYPPYGIVDLGTPDVTSTTSLWTVGDAGTAKQEWTDLFNQRVVPPSGNPTIANVDLSGGFIHDGSTAMTTPQLVAQSPGYITGSGNLYSFTGDYGAKLNVSNYGGATGSQPGGTLVILQTSGGLNPDVRPLYNVGAPTDAYPNYNPLGIVFTRQDGSPLPQPAEILNFGINFANKSVTSSFGLIAWQELLWAAWLPEWSGDFQVNFSISIHSAFSSARVDTAIGTMNGSASFNNFLIPEPKSLLLIAIGITGLLCWRLRRSRGWMSAITDN